jgi:N-acetylneuraminic acid mutarotase
MNYPSRGIKTSLLCVLSVLAAACGNGGAANFPMTVGGSINGLTSGTQLQLEIDGRAPITVATNGPFVFPVSMPLGASYSVTVSGQPMGQSCEVWNATGTVGASPAGSVFVTCTAVDRTVSGTVSGLLAGRSLVLEDDGGNSTTVAADGGFTFSTPVAGGSNYAVTVFTQPAGQHCAVTDGTGTMGSNEVSNVSVDCSNGTYNVAVTVTGLAGAGLTLKNNGGSALSISSNGTFNFNQPVASGSAYAVTVASEPLGQTCSVSNGTGTVQSSNVTNIGVLCVSNLYQISGTLTGLLAGRSIVLQDNGGSSTVVSANGGFTFATPVASGSGYAVTIFTQPVGQTCSVAMGSGTVAGADVGSVAVNCSDNTYDIQVSASGLLRSGLTLQDNGADNLSIGANGTYDFSTPLASGAGYAVTVLTQPPGESCSVSNGSGPVVSATVTGIGVACAPISYSISGSVSGLLHGNSLVLEDNGGNPIPVSGPVSGSVGFTFSTQVASGSGYAVTVSTQPPGQNCAVTNGSGPVVSSNVTGVTVNCSDYSYNVQATVTGLLSGNSIVLQDNGGDNLSFSTDGTANFATAVASGSAYNVTISSAPPGENCTLSNGSGTMASSTVAVTVNCTPIDYSIGGSVSGLLNDNSLGLEDNGGNLTPVVGTVSGTVGFTFSTKVASGSNYAVSISSQPVGQNCSLTYSSGIVGAANVTNVGVSCSDYDYNIHVSVSSLTGNGLVLQDNGGDNLPVAANGGSTVTSTFATAVAAGSAYDVTVLTQPSGQFCSVTAPHSGVVAGADVTVAVTCVNTYTVGGTLSGLATGGSVTLEDNGVNALTLSSNGAFAFTTPLAQGTVYTVTISMQPSGQVCSLSGAHGTVGAGNVTTVQLICAGAWTWMSGSKLQGGTAVYNVPGTSPTSNTPSNRYSSLTWSDAVGNLWLFGGASYDAHGNNVYFNDLWKYNPGTGWTYIGGSTGTNVSGLYGMLGTAAPGNAPGSRSSPVSWTDSAGNLWLFGGYGYDSAGSLGNLNDLWEFSPITSEWTWVGGSSTQNAYGVYGTLGSASLNNIPGARNSAVSWTDGSGNFWLFSGNGQAQSGTGGSLNDLWMFNSTLGWTWVSGSNGLDQVGSYGAAGDPGNVPGARTLSSAWIDGSNNLWVFGGQGYDSAGHFGYMNDLWQYSPSAKAWTWESGSSTVSGLAVYGTKGVPSVSNVPGARGYSNGWIDTSGNLWLFGGYSYNATGTQGIVDDLWMYAPGAATWTWVGGSATADAEGVYGTQRLTAASNVPGARYSASAWTDSSGNFWLFGGEGFDSGDSGGVLNDLWEYIP